MPQCVAGNWRHQDNPYGAGSLHSELQQASFRVLRRAAKLNEGEMGRYRKFTNFLDRHRRCEEERKEKVMAKVRNTIQQLEAYQVVLRSYRVDHFRTIPRNGGPAYGLAYQAPAARRTPETFRRRHLETRIYNCGFTKDTLQPEVKRVLERSRPELRKRAYHDRLLTVSQKRSDFLIDRKITDGAMRRERLAREGLVTPETAPSDHSDGEEEG